MESRYNKILNDTEFIQALRSITESEKGRIFCGHGIEHLIDTARIGYILILENSFDIPKDIIYAAALLHDIGRLSEYENGTPHNVAGAVTAQRILDRCGYNKSETSLIADAIEHHRTPDKDPGDMNVSSSLGSILHKADKLSRMCRSCAALPECNWPDSLKNYDIKY